MAEEEQATWQYQVRDKEGNVVGDWVTPADAEFKWPRLGTGHEKWVKKGKKWQKLSK